MAWQAALVHPSVYKDFGSYWGVKGIDIVTLLKCNIKVENKKRSLLAGRIDAPLDGIARNDVNTVFRLRNKVITDLENLLN